MPVGSRPTSCRNLYRLADLFVMPSAEEGSGIVFLEAVASGLRSIGGNADGSIHVLADGVIGTAIDPNDSEGLAHAIMMLLRVGSRSVRRRPFRFDKFFLRHVRDLV